MIISGFFKCPSCDKLHSLWGISTVSECACGAKLSVAFQRTIHGRTAGWAGSERSISINNREEVK